MTHSQQEEGDLRYVLSIVILDTSTIRYVIFIQGIKLIATLEALTEE